MLRNLANNTITQDCKPGADVSSNGDTLDELVHSKRVSQILRYISTLHTNQGNDEFSFVRSAKQHTYAFFAQNEDVDDVEGGRVLFTTYDFQLLAAICTANNKNSSNQVLALPFAFYSSIGQTKSTQRTARWRSLDRSAAASKESSCCWLRLTRMTQSAVQMKPNANNAQIQAYLQKWSQQAKIPVKQLLSLEHLEQAPNSSNTRVKNFLRNYQTYLRQKHLQRRLEPVYNSLFEWYHESASNSNVNDLDLVWGMGQAILQDDEEDSDMVLDGPLLEVKVEVELARDGALLVRPKKHTGVTWNRSVLQALQVTDTKKWNGLVDVLDPCQDINPSQPASYTPFLKQLAVECSSGGSFVSSGKMASRSSKPSSSLVVTDAWCLYASPRPSAVWARDALAFSEKRLVPSESPVALWALTHGPGAVEHQHRKTLARSSRQQQNRSSWSFQTLLPKREPALQPTTAELKHFHFPLPSSEAQDQIADLLLAQNYPAVVCEGPPGTGKTHTIANIVCAYLCQGKRVLVTSKGSPALGVLRERLPTCVQELCVDVSMSESVGMRQLQQTVERLANKVSWIQTGREQRRADALLEEIQQLKGELQKIDEQLLGNADRKREVVQSMDGQKLIETSLMLIESTPWLMTTFKNWDVQQVSRFCNTTREFIEEPRSDLIKQVTGYPEIPSEALISLASSRAGMVPSCLKNIAMGALASVPWLGSTMSQHCLELEQELGKILVANSSPCSPDEWKLVVRAMENERAFGLYRAQVLDPLIRREGWPEPFFFDETEHQRRRVKPNVADILDAALTVKKLQAKLDVMGEVKDVNSFLELDARRAGVSTRILQLSEELVACRVVAELSQNFSAEAQSALVKFSQVSGKARFGKSSQLHRMTQRQRRKRQEYLEAFEKCVRYIPCWVLTSAQISDYLPADVHLFDLVVIDEASQSDITVLPGMLRGKQWLIVGDGKQVSPTESFVAEDTIETLKLALPDSPFEDSMLPGHSFFDLCAQAFPTGRIILREHFRSAPEIISFSNSEFYSNNLIPLRLPTREERINPSLLDIRLGGKKVGKVNHQECDEIVRRIKEYVEGCTLARKRSIGVISLVGDEQSRLIRGRLLDNIGPHKYKLHDILVGEPPSFQGAERDIVFLSLVCSPGCVVTQNQLMHFQRANVALSRARDQMLLVRSIDIQHIANQQDVKVSVLDFFGRYSQFTKEAAEAETDHRPVLSPFRTRSELLLQTLLEERGFQTRRMGVVWEDAICVEDHGTVGDNEGGGGRAAICIEAAGESEEDWKGIMEQQKSIERVGWKCLRVDAMSFLSNHTNVLLDIERFLSSSGVRPERQHAEGDDVPNDDEADGGDDGAINEGVEEGEHEEELLAGGQPADDEEAAVVISSDDENGRNALKPDEQMADDADADRKMPPPPPVPLAAPSMMVDGSGLGNGEVAEDYGHIADLGFLRTSDGSVSLNSRGSPRTRRQAARKPSAKRRRVRKHADNDLAEKQRAVSTSSRRSLSSFSFDGEDDISSSSASSDESDDESHALASASSSTNDCRDSRKRRKRKSPRLDNNWDPSLADPVEDVRYEHYMKEVVPDNDTGMEEAVPEAGAASAMLDEVNKEQDGAGDGGSESSKNPETKEPSENTSHEETAASKQPSQS